MKRAISSGKMVFIKKAAVVKKAISMKRVIALIVLSCFFMVICSGCKAIKIEEAERKQMEFTLIQQDEVPETIKNLIDERKMREFQFTYKSGNELYLFKGYGQQMTGGYSIQVIDLSESENAIFFETALIGPEKADVGSEPSYPYIGVKLEYQDKPVQFR